MNYTPFGKFFKTLRINHDETIADAVQFLGVSPAYVSAVETGKRQIPETWKDKIILHYRLSNNEIEELEKSILLSQDYIKVDVSNCTDYQKETAIVFGRSFLSLDEEKSKQIQKILKDYHG